MAWELLDKLYELKTRREFTPAVPTPEYSDRYEVTLNNGWARVRSTEPIVKRPSGNEYLDYNIEIEDPRPGVTLEDRSRNVWLRTAEGLGVQSVSYCGGMGIWQVSQGREPIAFNDLTPDDQEMVRDWLSGIDEKVFKEIPKLKKLFK